MNANFVFISKSRKITVNNSHFIEILVINSFNLQIVINPLDIVFSCNKVHQKVLYTLSNF